MPNLTEEVKVPTHKPLKSKKTLYGIDIKKELEELEQYDLKK